MKEQLKIDSHNLMYHPKRVAEWLEKGDCYPIYVEIGPTNRCNHRCIYCALDWIAQERSHSIDRDTMLSTLEDMAAHGVKSVMFAGEGEPLLHKNISKFIISAREYGLCTSITTNGVLFNEEKAEKCLPYLTWIRFSIDAGTKESYAKIHRTKEKDFDKVIENIKKAVEIKKIGNLKVNISTQFILIPENMGDMGELEKLAEIVKKAGVDNLQVKPYSQHPKSINKFVVNYKDYGDLKFRLEKFNTCNFKIFFREQTIQRLKEYLLYDRCSGVSFFALIDAKGDIIPCNLFYDNPEFVYGNLHEKSFSDIWKSEQRKKVLEKLMGRGIEGCREVCRLDASNRYLHDLKNLPEYANFI